MNPFNGEQLPVFVTLDAYAGAGDVWERDTAAMQAAVKVAEASGWESFIGPQLDGLAWSKDTGPGYMFYITRDGEDEADLDVSDD